MWVSGREAAEMLVGAGVTRRRAALLLRCGVAGPVVRTSSSLLVERERVVELCARPFVHPAAAMELAEDGMFVCRRGLDVLQPPDEVWAAAARDWSAISPWTLIALAGAARRRPVRFVATVAGFVVLGADLQGVRSGSAEGPAGRPAGGPAGGRGAGAVGPELVLSQPGPWFAEHVKERGCAASRAGRGRCAGRNGPARVGG